MINYNFYLGLNNYFCNWQIIITAQKFPTRKIDFECYYRCGELLSKISGKEYIALNSFSTEKKTNKLSFLNLSGIQNSPIITSTNNACFRTLFSTHWALIFQFSEIFPTLFYKKINIEYTYSYEEKEYLELQDNFCILLSNNGLVKAVKIITEKMTVSCILYDEVIL